MLKVTSIATRTYTPLKDAPACCFMFPSLNSASRSSADSGIDARVAKGTWQRIVDNLTAEIGAGRQVEGFIRAIERIGIYLAEHFPPESINPNELPDHLIILRN